MSQSNVPLALSNGASAYIEATNLGGEEPVAFGELSLEEIAKAIEGISEALIGALEKAKPSKAVIEFGVEVALESGKLTALFVQGQSKANLKVSLEWASESAAK